MSTKSPKTVTTHKAGRRPPGDTHAASKAVPAETIASKLPAVDAAQIAAARQKFEQGIVTRGEAVARGAPLPKGATHEVTGIQPDGSPLLKRKRFSVR